MVRFSNPSSSSSKARENWRYDRIDQLDAEDSTDEASASVVEAVEGEMDQLPRHGTGLRKSEDTVTLSGPRALESFDTSRSLGGTTLAHQETFDAWDEDEPSALERETLRKIPDQLPYSAFLVAVVELCERFAYYGMSGPFQNYISNKYKDPSGVPGAIGLNQSGATALNSFFTFWCYVTPILGAVCADQWLGKYNTIVLFSCFYTVGLLILFVTSLPSSIEAGYALGGLVTSMIIIGLGTGGIKSNVSPLIAEQYQGTKQKIRVLSSGERVIVDPALTIQRIYMIFYMCINIGSLSALATTTLELHIGFWSAYLLPFLMFCVGFVVLVAGKKKYVIRPPRGSVIMHAVKALWIGARHPKGLDGAKPSLRKTIRHPNELPWDDQFVDELKRAIVACKVFIAFPIFWLVFQQMQNNFISQAGTMDLHGIPNDIMQNIDAFTIVIFIPIFDRFVYPSLRKMGIQLKPITRIAWGLLLATIAMFYAVYVQRTIYSAGPCYDHPLKCEAAKQPDGKLEHNHVHVALQTPAYFLVAIAEILASITGLEYAYTKAPASMKSFIMAMFLLTSAGGAALGAAIAPLTKDPNLAWFYLGLAFVSGVTTITFWLLFKKYNALEDSMNELGASTERGVRMDRIPKIPLSKTMSNLDLRSLVSSKSKLSNDGNGSPLREATNVDANG